jgi:ArsR family transcriptional regulator
MADIFDVIADETRRQMLQLLLESYNSGSGELSVSELVTATGLTQPTVSKQLKVLREAGLVGVREDGQHRLYHLDASPLEAVEDWAIPFLSVNFPDDEDDVVYERLLGAEMEAAAVSAGSVAASTVFHVTQAFAGLQASTKDAVTKVSETVRKASRRS